MEKHDETEHQRRDRELGELLQELRVVLPGIQVLFAFLLVLPFQSRFGSLPRAGRVMYMVTLMASAAAAALLIAPASVHRLNFRGHDKEWILRTAQRCVVAGTATLAVAMTGAVIVVTSAMYGAWAALPASGTALVIGWLWLALPLQGPRHPRAGV